MLNLSFNFVWKRFFVSVISTKKDIHVKNKTDSQYRKITRLHGELYLIFSFQDIFQVFFIIVDGAITTNFLQRKNLFALN